VGLFFYEGGAQIDLVHALTHLKLDAAQNIWIFIGSEGGFSQNEVELFKSHGLNPLSFGSQILRVETACLAAVSVIKYQSGLMK
jgi:16S rRNA (uracil1498-N3)-methyltransferase